MRNPLLRRGIPVLAAALMAAFLLPCAGELRGEPCPGAFGALVRLRGDKAAGLEDPPDGGHRRHLFMPLGQMVVNGRRAGAGPGARQFLAQRGDLRLPPAGDPGRAVMGPAGAAM